jgi:hypothetical protein
VKITGLKKLGSCICCGDEIFHVLEYDRRPDSPLLNHPIRVGPMKEHGTQIEFLLSDGSQADISCCVDCAAAIRPEDYQTIWQAVIDRAVISLRDRPANERRRLLAQYTRIFPLALLAWRRPHGDWPQMVLDRRGPKGVA